MSNPSHVTIRKHGFLSSTAMGLSAILITLLICCTVVVIYGVHLAGEKSERVVSLAQDAVRGLPALRESLPPAVSDMLDDRRRPDYCEALAISARLAPAWGNHGIVRTTLEITNNGEEVVSMLSLRIVIVDGEGRILDESNEWAATPFAADDGLRGPIMPGSKRLFVSRHSWLRDVSVLDELRGEVEITELRVWNRGEEEVSGADSELEAARAVSAAETLALPESG